MSTTDTTDTGSTTDTAGTGTESGQDGTNGKSADKGTADSVSGAQNSDTQDTDTADKALGDAGKQAIDRMKAERKAAREQAAAEKTRADALQAKLDGKEAEHAEQEKARQAELAALAKADERILKAEVRAAAAAKLADPADALLHIDLSEFEVDSDGAVDGAAIAAAIDDLIVKKPYLSAQGGKRFEGTADGGARNDAATSKQLTRAQMERMSPAEIDTATRAGLFNDLMAGKQ